MRTITPESFNRDLKPSNLMVNQRGDLKVADFRHCSQSERLDEHVDDGSGKSGTLLYMSPQQLDGERGNHLDDIYSLGASPLRDAYQQTTILFRKRGSADSRKNTASDGDIERRELEIEGGPIEEHWEAIVRQCLAKDPARRPQSVAEVAQRLNVPSPALAGPRQMRPNKRVSGHFSWSRRSYCSDRVRACILDFLATP